jgi:hypothetical protein
LNIDYRCDDGEKSCSIEETLFVSSRSCRFQKTLVINPQKRIHSPTKSKTPLPNELSIPQSQHRQHVKIHLLQRCIREVGLLNFSLLRNCSVRLFLVHELKHGEIGNSRLHIHFKVFEKMGLELDISERTTQTNHRRIYSLPGLEGRLKIFSFTEDEMIR